MKNTPFEKQALNDVTIDIPVNSRVAIVGHTGSGKSTLVQHLNGLLVPTEGELKVGDHVIRPDTKQKELRQLRQKVGMVFQFPEHQLFDETVEKDVAFGPINFGVEKQKALRIARHALAKVGLEDEEIITKSPFELSGGQMRRVAIAGVLVNNPNILILDEPTAGLDPQGRKTMMNLFSDWQQEKEKRSYVLVTHHMEDAARFADYIYVMYKGRLAFEGTPNDVFSNQERLMEWGLKVPQTTQLLLKLQDRAGESLNVASFDIESAAREIVHFLGKDTRDV